MACAPCLVGFASAEEREAEIRRKHYTLPGVKSQWTHWAPAREIAHAPFWGHPPSPMVPWWNRGFGDDVPLSGSYRLSMVIGAVAIVAALWIVNFWAPPAGGRSRAR